MEIKAPTFKDGMIPIINGCEGNDESPELLFENVPKNAQSLALIVDDPDAPFGTYVHWVAWNMDPNIKSLPSNIKVNEPNNPIQQGLNSAKKLGYMGPCPPSGTHRYYFKLYALDTKLNLPAGINKEKLLEAMKDHIIAEAQVMGKYQKNQK